MLRLKLAAAIEDVLLEPLESVRRFGAGARCQRLSATAVELASASAGRCVVELGWRWARSLNVELGVDHHVSASCCSWHLDLRSFTCL